MITGKLKIEIGKLRKFKGLGKVCNNREIILRDLVNKGLKLLVLWKKKK
jgi:hypothetical protein